MISKYSVKKPMTVAVAMILVVLLGCISFTKMTTDLLPSIDLPYVMIITSYPGASPEKIETAVTKPLESVLATTSGVKNINSVSSENSSTIMLEFNQDVNMDSAIIEMNSKIDMVKAQLKDETIGSPMMMKLNPDMLPVMVASVDVSGLDVKEVTKVVKEDIIPEFERIDGVASVSGIGLVEKKLKIQLDDKKIDSINNKVLSSVDDKLAEGKTKLDAAKAKLEDSKKILAKEREVKSSQIVDSSIAISDGRIQLENALKNLPKTQNELEKKREGLIKQKELLEELIKWQMNQGIPVLDEEKNALEQFNIGIKQIDDGIEAIKQQKPDLEAKLIELSKGQKNLEVGKMILSEEMAKASVTISNAEAELDKNIKQFEESRDEAYKKAGVKEVFTKDTISKILKAENFAMPAGYINESGEKYLVKVGEQFSTVEELENLLLFNINVEGVGPIYLKDVAKVEFIDNAEDMYAKVNGNDGVVLSFQKQSTASTAAVSDKINETIKKMESSNDGINITPLDDQGIYINVVVQSVLNNLILGGILAVIILFIFLRSIKPTIIIAFSIPISLLFAVVMMYFSGVTMNIISLAGLALGVGMLVDNSIVVIENIYRLRNQGVNAAKAAVKGAAQVSGAIFTSTLTTICVFLPIVFTEGISRQLFTDMGLTIAYSLIASLVIALTLVPAMSSNMLIQADEKEHKFFDKFVEKYERILGWSLKHKASIMILVVIMLVVSIAASVSKGTILMPSMDSNQISISIKMPKGSTRDEARAMSDIVMDRILTIEDIDTAGAMQNSGSSTMMGMGGNENSVSFYVLLNKDKKLSSKEVADIITEKTSDLDCKIKVQSSNMDMSALGGSGISVEVKGNNIDRLKQISKDIAEILKDTEGTIDISDGLDGGTMETRIVVDKNKAMEKGLTVAQVYQEVASAIISESEATTLNVESNEYPVILVNDDESKLNREDLKNHEITIKKDGNEETVLLKEIAVISEEQSLKSINREGQIRAMTVKAYIDSSHNIGLVSNDFKKKLKNYDVPEGYTVEMKGEDKSIKDAFTDLVKMIALAIAFIYLIMVAQFQSLLSPFIVLFTIPLAFTGGFLALALTGFEISMIALLGFLVLSGVVVNNGIVFVDYVNQLRLEGMDKKEAILVTGKTRIRPILMTALTTILGLSTLAMGIGMGSDMIQPMAIVTIGGLSYATILTLFVVPIMYDILHRKPLKPIVIDDNDLK
ncbi:efflux RND transporter permease subunit [Clostridium cadaveris]|uniref:efflux RND transporter permease subunit n=1 Tax=Clostridium cadaveris TaxID=1529 RepID=UPI0015B3A270|nr:efflux RND transporter permease subunit [Clostridium cadaveris]NWK10620.1 efflux RND transporter permease subunit [Clostridium cadaveris]